MPNPKMQPCPKCGETSGLAVYKYDHGGQHVECDHCFYLGPCEGSIRAAIRAHNLRTTSSPNQQEK